MARPVRKLGAWLFALAPMVSFAAPTAPAAPATPAPSPSSMSLQARALASPVPVWIRNGLLVEQGGRALYVFDHDLPDESQCDSRCMALWPPHYAAGDATPHGPFTIARASDGRPMWAYRGKPLYRWVSDRKRGAAGGDGVSGVWFLVRVPAAAAAQVVPYFPMPMPRPGAASPPSRVATKNSDR